MQDRFVTCSKSGSKQPKLEIVPLGRFDKFQDGTLLFNYTPQERNLGDSSWRELQPLMSKRYANALVCR